MEQEGEMKKDLPESKPEKNCGNCALGKPFLATNRICAQCEKESEWKPVAAEPQGWEQFIWDITRDENIANDVLKLIIGRCRAEIEAAREEEKQAIVAFLRGHWLMTDGIAPMASDIEQNRHREGGK